MKRPVFFLLLFSIVSKFASGQLTEIKSIDTIQISGKILFIDSLCHMAKHYDHGGSYIPYYLVLIAPNAEEATKFNMDHRIVVRVINIETLKSNGLINLKIKRTEYSRFPAEGVWSNKLDSMLQQVDKQSLRISILEHRPCYDYSLKEKLYYRYEIVE